MEMKSFKNELLPLVKSGVKGFKCFLIDSGVEVRVLIFMDAKHKQERLNNHNRNSLLLEKRT